MSALAYLRWGDRDRRARGASRRRATRPRSIGLRADRRPTYIAACRRSKESVESEAASHSTECPRLGAEGPCRRCAFSVHRRWQPSTPGTAETKFLHLPVKLSWVRCRCASFCAVQRHGVPGVACSWMSGSEARWTNRSRRSDVTMQLRLKESEKAKNAPDDCSEGDNRRCHPAPASVSHQPVSDPPFLRCSWSSTPHNGI